MTKNIITSFVAIVFALFLVASVSAIVPTQVTVDEVLADNVASASVIAGEQVTVKVWFTASANASDVTVKAELEGDKVDTQAVSDSFDVEAGKVYKKTLVLNVPYELKDEVSSIVDLTVTIDADSKVSTPYTLRVQRPSYNAEIKSVSVSNTADAGETVPVDFVIKNMGYNDLEDIYATVSIPALGVSKTAYLDDLVTIESCDNNDCEKVDTVSGRLSVAVPYGAKAGVYALEVKVSNDDTTSTVVKQIVINNEFADNVIVTNAKQTVATGETATYNVMLVNPTNKLKVYKVVAESSEGLSSDVSESVVAVPAGSTRTVAVTAEASKVGDYTFNVNVFAGEELSSKTALSLKAEGSSFNLVTVVAIILSIVFIVLLVVLIVLLAKRPEKTEVFGESYY